MPKPLRTWLEWRVGVRDGGGWEVEHFEFAERGVDADDLAQGMEQQGVGGELQATEGLVGSRTVIRGGPTDAEADLADEVIAVGGVQVEVPLPLAQQVVDDAGDAAEATARVEVAALGSSA